MNNSSLYRCQILCLSLLLICSTIAFTQENDPMDRMSFMRGEWQGTGWMVTQTGKVKTDVWENVACKIDCSVLAIDGKGVVTDSITGDSRIVHDAFGVIAFDSQKQAIIMKAYTADGDTESELEFLDEKIYKWGFDIPNGGSVRFTVDFSVDNTWNEIGEFSRDGNTWVQFLEMHLERVE